MLFYPIILALVDIMQQSFSKNILNKLVINLFSKKLRLFSRKRKEPYSLFYKVLGFYPHNIDYYQLAIRHKSAPIITKNGKILSNEHLEFLGDAVLNSIISDILFLHYKNKDEGFLTTTRSKIVNRFTLNRLSLELGLQNLVKIAKHVNVNNINDIYGNALEALIGAIYLDKGYENSKQFVKKRLLCLLDLEKLEKEEINYKSKLIEWCQKNKIPIEFEVVSENLSKDNKHVFHSHVLIDGKIISESEGYSKKESQQNASRLAYEQIILRLHVQKQEIF
ncbi:MAG TPA: ribonuclease III [Paludibacteraceae bacterium]|nr:ribonuclease III [Paludibacteraceae bacterium]